MTLKCYYIKNDGSSVMFKTIDGDSCPVVPGYTVYNSTQVSPADATTTAGLATDSSPIDFSIPNIPSTPIPIPTKWPPEVDWPITIDPPKPGNWPIDLEWPPKGWPKTPNSTTTPAPSDEETLKDARRKTIARSTKVKLRVSYCNDRIDVRINGVTVVSLVNPKPETSLEYDKDLTAHLELGENSIVVNCYNQTANGRCSFDIELGDQLPMSWDVADVTNGPGAPHYKWFYSTGLRVSVVRT